MSIDCSIARSLIDGLASNIEVFTREINAEDCLLLTSFSPYSRESLDVLNAARQAGARIIAITDSPVSPLAQTADCTLLFSSAAPLFSFDSVRYGRRRVFAGDAGCPPR
jgi:DNA-binding MurR/RpiR family transcriptional regulator